jgi:hypothetical protein
MSQSKADSHSYLEVVGSPRKSGSETGTPSPKKRRTTTRSLYDGYSDEGEGGEPLINGRSKSVSSSDDEEGGKPPTTRRSMSDISSDGTDFLESSDGEGTKELESIFGKTKTPPLLKHC